MIRSSVDSVSKASGQKLFTREEQLFQQYREYEKELDGAWSHPAEKAVHSNRTTQSNEIYFKEECRPDTFMEMKENYWHTSDSRDSCREIYSNLSTPNAQYQCFMSDCDPRDPEREIVERSEQTSNSTVSKPTSPISDESSGKRPAKRLKADAPTLVNVNQVESSKDQKPVTNENHVSGGETVQSEITELPAKSPCSSLGDINTDSNNMLEQGSEDAPNTELVKEEELYCAKGDIEMNEANTVAFDQTPRGVSLSTRRKRGASILYALTAEELRDHMSSLINQHTCLVSGLPFQSPVFSVSLFDPVEPTYYTAKQLDSCILV